MNKKAVLALLGFASFVVYLLGYAAFLALESYLGGGQAFLWLFLLAPILFIVFCLFAGGFSFAKTGSVGGTVLAQFIAFFVMLALCVCVEIFSGKHIDADYDFSLFYLDAGLLCANPLLTYCGVRIVRVFRALRERRRARKTEVNTGKVPPTEER